MERNDPGSESRPPRIRWGTPIKTGALPQLFDAFTRPWATEPTRQFREALPKRELIVEQRLESGTAAAE